jgi:hypothetical protein
VLGEAGGAERKREGAHQRQEVVVVRNGAETWRRSFGGFVVFGATLALTLFNPGPALALAPSETVIGLSLEQASTGKEALAIRGASVESETARFSAVATLSRLPCAGSYRYELDSENQDTGALSSYTALVTLAPFASVHAVPCGGVPPAEPGALRISVAGDEEAIDFRQGRRSGSGSFFGAFTMGTQPICHQTYRISVSVDLRSWHRSVRYRLKVARWESEAQGRQLESRDCD